MRSLAVYLLMLFCAACPGPARADGGPEHEFFQIEKASLEELLDVPTSVASLTSIRLREAPGLVTVISREEIQASGARDLVDVLSLVPELTFGTDIMGTLALGVRGCPAQEGKALLLWDGQVYNEPLYSSLQFDRFPVDQVEEIEIIKGPGSAIYGGNAELAVINIKTRTAGSLSGHSSFAAYGQGARARARSYAGYSYGAVARGGAEIAAKVFWSDAQRSDRRYTDLYGASYGMNGNSPLRARSLNIYASSGGTSARLILDDFSQRERDHYDSLLSTGSARVGFPALLAEVRRSLRFGDRLELEPYLNYSEMRPWLEKDDYFYYDKRTSRLVYGLTSRYSVSGSAEFTGGAEYTCDRVKVGDSTDPAFKYAGGKDSADYDSFAFFGQAALDLAAVKLTAGARYDKHSQYGAALSPRLALTRLAGGVNFKAIYSLAFRAPPIESMRMNPAIDPETSRSAELEAGYKASDTLFLSASLFRTEIRKTIVYGYVGTADTYTNYDRTGTSGFGLGARFKNGPLRADLGYLFNETNGNRVDSYAVPGHGSYLLGMPRHKLTLNSSLPLAYGLSLNPSAFYLSRRYGYTGASARAYGAVTVANLNLRLKDRPLAGLAVSLGVRDLFNSGYSHVQPYDGGHAPLPAPSREFFLKADYEF